MYRPPLKLRGIDPQDVAVISAALQNAVTNIGDMAYLHRQHTFALMFDRFRWEEDGRICRIRAGLHFNDILKVETQGIDATDKAAALELLFLSAAPTDDEADGAAEPTTRADIALMFAGGGIIRLTADCVNCVLMDVGDPWDCDKVPEGE